MQVVAVRLAEMPELAVRSEAIRAEAVRAEVIQVVAVPAKAIQAEIRAGVQAPVMVGQPEAQRMQATADHSAEVVEGRLGWEVVVGQQAAPQGQLQGKGPLHGCAVGPPCCLSALLKLPVLTCPST